MSVIPIADVEAISLDLRELRRRLHRAAEIGLQLPRTQALVLEALDGLPLEITTGTAATSVVAVLRGTGPRPADGGAVLLRGDMDALPVTERTGEPFVADGEVMHACGHDLHTTGLVGAARLLCRHRDQVSGDVVFMFQPGEEGWDGAGVMITEGVLTAAGVPVRAGYGLHVMSSMLPRGTVATRPGPLMAASAGWSVTVRGRGGHGSRPHEAADPVVVAAELVTALQTMVTRRADIFDPVVITVGQFHAGTRGNIIPEEARFEATMRALSPESMAKLRAWTIELCTRLPEAYGLSSEVEFSGGYPVSVNTPEETALALDVARDLFGPDRVVELPDPIMGSEDFSRVLAAVGGCFLFLGACASDDFRTAPSNHSPLARFDDSVLPDAARLLAELAIAELDR
jgi:amidohydrolase